MAEDYNKMIGTRVKMLRITKGISQTELAKKIGVTQTHLSNIENGRAGLTIPNLIPIFFGIVIGVIFGSLPIKFPGIPQPIKLGLAGGPLIIAILLGYFGPKLKITTYTTLSARELDRK